MPAWVSPCHIRPFMGSCSCSRDIHKHHVLRSCGCRGEHAKWTWRPCRSRGHTIDDTWSAIVFSTQIFLLHSFARVLFHENIFPHNCSIWNCIAHKWNSLPFFRDYSQEIKLTYPQSKRSFLCHRHKNNYQILGKTDLQNGASSSGSRANRVERVAEYRVGTLLASLHQTPYLTSLIIFHPSCQLQLAPHRQFPSSGDPWSSIFIRSIL